MTMRRRPYLTTRAHAAFSLAFDLAAQRGDHDVTPIHVALGLLREGRGVAVGLLDQRGVPLDALARELEAQLPPPGTAREPAATYVWTREAERLVEAARAEAQAIGTEYYGGEHLLLALLRDDASATAQVLARNGVRWAEVDADLRRLMDDNRAGGSSAGERATDPLPAV